MKRLKTVEASPKSFTLDLTWEDGSKQSANLAGLIRFSTPFHRFLEAPNDFQTVEVINWGHGVAWANGLDYSAENLEQIANAQQQEQGPELIKEFQKTFALTNEQTGYALGYKISHVKNLKSGHSPVTEAVRLAIHAMEQDPAILYARLASFSDKQTA